MSGFPLLLLDAQQISQIGLKIAASMGADPKGPAALDLGSWEALGLKAFRRTHFCKRRLARSKQHQKKTSGSVQG